MILAAGLVLLPFILANLVFRERLVSSGRHLLDWAGREYQRRVLYGGKLPGEGDYDEDHIDIPSIHDLPQYRMTTGWSDNSPITCWPSKGGIYVLPVVRTVQRQFLGIDRRAYNILRPEVSAEVEDAFCNQLRKLGARWWQYQYDYWVYEIEDKAARNESVHVLYVGWPASGGVWALHANRRDASEKGYGVIYNSISMEEQCDMIKELGGTFYKDPKDCPYLDLAENEHDEKILEL